MRSPIDRTHASRPLALAIIIASVVTASSSAQTAREIRGAAAVEPVMNELPARIVVDPPLPDALSHGRVVIQYRTENLHVVPVFGPAALAVSPRIGHVHVTLDDAPWVWVQASEDPVILNGIPAGPHKVRLDLETANHHLLDKGTVEFTVPQVPSSEMAAATSSGGGPAGPATSEPAATLAVDAPQAEPLSRGVVFLQYRAEHLQIVPVFGPEALAITPRVGHIHVTVDNAPWHWADASGAPIIINGLAAGPHTILIQLVNANHHPIDQRTIQVTVPAANP